MYSDLMQVSMILGSMSLVTRRLHTSLTRPTCSLRDILKPYKLMKALSLDSQVTRPGLRSLSITASARLVLISSSQARLSWSRVVTGTGR